MMSVGHKIADLVGILGSIDLVLGEVDRELLDFTLSINVGRIC